MSWQACDAPDCDQLAACDPVEHVIIPKLRDIGSMTVRRALPAAVARSVGPVVFLDEMGPADYAPGDGMDVRAHPHIGLSTLTWLLEGTIRHKDSLGTEIDIEPGAVNWMTAGKGIVHSERTPPGPRAAGQRVHGLQLWLALPEAEAERDPSFQHVAAADLPKWTEEGAEITLVAGTGWGRTSPVDVYMPTLIADIALGLAGEDTCVTVPAEHPERAVYVVTGEVGIGDATFKAGQLVTLRAGLAIEIAASDPARLMLIGGVPLDGPRKMFWNFVATTQARIEEAKDDWANGRFDAVPGEDDPLPLP